MKHKELTFSNGSAAAVSKAKRKMFQTFMWMKKCFSSPSYEFIATDITSNCNLRCTFCINDFSQIRGSTLMTETTFERVLTLIPLVNGCYFSISCLFEPTIHPLFISFLEKIPRRHRARVFFTTNLCANLSDRDFQRLSLVNIHHINISIDSFQRDTFETLRQKARYDIFIDNLQRLVDIFFKAVNPPRLHFITVALKPNLDEIPTLVETCAQKYLAHTHEIRYVYQVPHLSSEWKQQHLITNRDWQRLRDFAQEIPYNCDVVHPPAEYYPEDHQPYSRRPNEISSDDCSAPANSLPLGLNVKSDGTVSLYGKPDIQYKLNELEEPGKFFRRQINHFRPLIRNHPAHSNRK